MISRILARRSSGSVTNSSLSRKRRRRFTIVYCRRSTAPDSRNQTSVAAPSAGVGCPGVLRSSRSLMTTPIFDEARFFRSSRASRLRPCVSPSRCSPNRGRCRPLAAGRPSQSGTATARSSAAATTEPARQADDRAAGVFDRELVAFGIADSAPPATQHLKRRGRSDCGGRGDSPRKVARAF
jgi:hypothetical protein